MIHDLKSLSALSRPELQEVALKFNLNTTLKSETIIKRLLAITEDSSVSDNCPNASSSNEVPLTADNLAAHNSFVGVTPESLHVPRRPKPPRPPPSDFDFASQQSSDIGDDIGDDEPLASQEQLKATVNMMAEMDRQHKVTRRKVEKLHNTAEDLREHVALLRQAIASQRSRRERLEKYMLYWQKEPQHWSFKEVWDYPMQIWDERLPHGYYRQEVTSSNGDGPTDEEITALFEDGKPLAGKHFEKQKLPIPEDTGQYDFLASTTPATQALPQAKSNGLQTKNVASGVSHAPAQLDEAVHHATRAKRRREEDDDETPADVERYQARIRKERIGVHTTTSLKGKEKMSAEDVQRMQEEAQDHLLREQETQISNDKEMATAGLGLPVEEIEEDRAASMAAAGKAKTLSSNPPLKKGKKTRAKNVKQSASKGVPRKTRIRLNI